MSSQIASEEYDLALKKGQKEYRELIMAGKQPYPAVLDDILADVSADTTQEVGVLDIPAERVIGIKSGGRISAFTATFQPLLDRNTEFAHKWISLCEAHLGETGITDPTELKALVEEKYPLKQLDFRMH